MPRRGFTLLEVLLTVVVLAILTGLAFGAWSFVERSRMTLTENRLDSLGFQIQSRVGVKGFPPSTLGDMAEAMGHPGWRVNGQFLDGWDRPIEYTVTGKQFKLWSCGADGVSGTADDHEFKRK